MTARRLCSLLSHHPTAPLLPLHCHAAHGHRRPQLKVCKRSTRDLQQHAILHPCAMSRKRNSSYIQHDHDVRGKSFSFYFRFTIYHVQTAHSYTTQHSAVFHSLFIHRPKHKQTSESHGQSTEVSVGTGYQALYLKLSRHASGDPGHSRHTAGSSWSNDESRNEKTKSEKTAPRRRPSGRYSFLI
jgi:hypothetical protein